MYIECIFNKIKHEIPHNECRIYKDFVKIKWMNEGFNENNVFVIDKYGVIVADLEQNINFNLMPFEIYLVLKGKLTKFIQDQKN